VFALCGCDSGITQETSDIVSVDNGQRITGQILLEDSEETISDFPVTVNDTVVKSSPQHVICLSSSLTEMIYELGFGDRLIGRGTYCAYPGSVLSLKDYGKPASPDLEAIKKAAPDLLITATSIPSKDITVLSELGIPVLYIASPRSVDEFGRIYTALGMVFEGLFEGEKKGADVFLGVKSALTSGAPSLGRFIYVTEGGFVAGGDTFEGSVLSLFGENIAKDSTGYSFDKSILSDDQPDVVVLNSDFPVSDLSSDDVFGKLDAVKNGKIISVSNSYFESPSGRITELVKELSSTEGAEDEA
jgi:iron complex transport system substrate-binding protein